MNYFVWTLVYLYLYVDTLYVDFKYLHDTQHMSNLTCQEGQLFQVSVQAYYGTVVSTMALV